MFVQNPLVTDFGDIVYKTGDFGKYSPDGFIEFIGRNDSLIKLNGVRIDLNEISNAVKDFKAILEVKCVLINRNDLNAFIACFYVSNVNLEQDLQSFGAKCFSSYETPKLYIRLDSLPLNSNGKVDTQKLISIAKQNGAVERQIVKASNQLEAEILDIWRTKLSIDSEIGVTDNFFLLGGNSLKAIMLRSEIFKLYGIKLNLKDLFTNPTVKGISELVKNGKKEQFFNIKRIENKQNYSLSSSQKRLWILDQYELASTAYNIPVILGLRGKVDIDPIEKSIWSLIKRHESLRTIFKEDESGQIKQWILPDNELRFRLEYIDSSTDGADKIQDKVEKLSNVKFSLENGPLIRTVLIKKSPEEYLLVLVVHHIVSDGWSMNVMLKDFVAFYNHYVSNSDLELPNLNLQYRDYACWQQENLNSDHFQAHKNYWLDKLNGELQTLDFPTDFVRPIIQTFDGAQVLDVFDEDTTAKINKLAQQMDVTLFMVFFGLVNILLNKYTSQTDIILGTPVAGRNHTDLFDQVGFYVNTLALRNQLDVEQCFVDFLSQVKENTLKSFEHEDYPFDELLTDLDLKKDISRNPLFDVLIALQNVEDLSGKIELNNIALFEYNSPNKAVSKFDFAFNFIESGNTINLELDYNTKLFKAETMKRLVVHLKQIIDQVLLNPAIKINKINIVDSVESNQLLNTFNSDINAFPRNKTIIDLFENQVLLHPNNIALVNNNVELSYDQLNEKVNQMTHYLLSNFDLRPNQLIGIKLDRNEWILIAILAVLKSGSAYVTIDTQYPEERINYIINDSDCKIIIDKHFLDDFRKEIETYPKSNPAIDFDSNSLAYVIYTSGSTGKPKGVMIKHASLVDLSLWQKDYFDLDSIETVSQTGSYSFDITVGEMVMAFTNGKKLVMIPNQELINIVEVINKYKIDVIVTVPSILKEVNPTKLIHKPIIISVGEKCHVNLKEQWEKYSYFYNGYGPTEYTVYSHCWSAKENINQPSVPIGKSRTNLKSYILNTDLNLLPVGLNGELYLSGPGISMGYWKNKELSFKSFKPNKFYIDELFEELPIASSFDIEDDEQFEEETFENIDNVLDISKMSVSDVNALLREEFDGEILSDALHIINENKNDNAFISAFLRYYLEGKYDNYKTSGLGSIIFSTFIAEEVNKDDFGIDFGCGSGDLLQCLFKNGYKNILGLDMNPYFIKSLCEKDIDAKVCKIDSPIEDLLSKLNFENRLADYVISTLTLDRVQNPKQLIKNMVTVLKENGVFILGTLLPVVEFEDGVNRNEFSYTNFQNKITPGAKTEEDKYYILAELINNNLSNINTFVVNIKVRSKNGIQVYDLHVFTGFKNENISNEIKDYTLMYKTGDVCKWLPDGNINFVGRVDEQVKLNGIRIELGEIENTLTQNSNIDEAVVIKKYKKSKEALFAFITLNSKVSAMDIKSAIKKQLPNYMVPADFIILDKLPLNSNGKIDRNALNEILDSRKEQVFTDYLPPESELEKELVGLYSEVLNIETEKIGLNDDFFELGGNSIKALVLINKIHEKYELKISLGDVLIEPNIKVISELIENFKWNNFIDEKEPENYNEISI